MTPNYEWLTKRVRRTVDGLKLWDANPRLNGDIEYKNVRDIAEELCSDSAERQQFLELLNSIAKQGFIPADPIVLWKEEEEGKYYVAEGNRRVLALKLIRKPSLAPNSIKNSVNSVARSINPELFEKIPVCIAPSFEEAEWYINQRHSTASLLKRWSSEKQARWLEQLYNRYNGDISIIEAKTSAQKSELEAFIRFNRLKDILYGMKGYFTAEQYAKIKTRKFSFTTLARFMTNPTVKEAWEIEFNGPEIIIRSDMTSFKNAYAELAKRMLLAKGQSGYIDSRTINTTEHIEKVLEELPRVTKSSDSNESATPHEAAAEVSRPQPKDSDTPGSANKGTNPLLSAEVIENLKKDPYRARVVLNEYYSINNEHYKLNKIFDTFTKLPVKTYTDAAGVLLRVFLDLSVLSFIKSRQLQQALCAQENKELKEIQLKNRLQYIRSYLNPASKRIIGHLNTHTNEFSLDALNNLVHSEDSHYIEAAFINRFWDFLLPLLQELVNIEEK